MVKDTPVSKALMWGIAGLIIIVFVIAMEDIREQNKDNQAVSNAIDSVEGSIGIDTQPQPQTNPLKVAFFVLLFLIAVVLIVLAGWWVYKEYIEDNSWQL